MVGFLEPFGKTEMEQNRKFVLAAKCIELTTNFMVALPSSQSCIPDSSGGHQVSGGLSKRKLTGGIGHIKYIREIIQPDKLGANLLHNLMTQTSTKVCEG